MCPILDRPTTVDRTAFCRDSWSLVRCRETGFVFLANPPDYSQLESEFAFEKTFRVERARRQVEEPMMSRLSGFGKRMKALVFPSRNKMATLAVSVVAARIHSEPLGILDIGCGHGGLMVELHQRFSQTGRGAVVWGIEVSEQLAAVSAERVSGFGGKVILANALDGLSKLDRQSIHLAVMSSFLEHECQPLGLLKRLHPVLTADGAVVLKVPNFACWNRVLRGKKWCGFRFPDHVNYFTPRTLRMLAHEAGYVVLRQNVLDKFPLSDNMYAVLAKNS
jgi:SAM-dependent methyltransferase